MLACSLLRVHRSLFGVFVAAILPVACSDAPREPTSSGGALTKCVPNHTRVCLCGLDEGVQTCTKDGEYTPCECAATQAPGRPTIPVPESDGEGSPEPEATCGDGKIDPGEACDDGNAEDGDGCSSRCLPDGAPKHADACPGQVLTLWKGATLTLTGTTEGYADDVQASCWWSTGPDRIYTLQPSADGFMTVDAAFADGFDAVVEVRRGTCDLVTANVLCEDTLSRPFKRVVQVEKDKNYYLIVDGDSPDARGAYSITLTLL